MHNQTTNDLFYSDACPGQTLQSQAAGQNQGSSAIIDTSAARYKPPQRVVFSASNAKVPLGLHREHPERRFDLLIVNKAFGKPPSRLTMNSLRSALTAAPESQRSREEVEATERSASCSVSGVINRTFADMQKSPLN